MQNYRTLISVLRCLQVARTTSGAVATASVCLKTLCVTVRKTAKTEAMRPIAKPVSGSSRSPIQPVRRSVHKKKNPHQGEFQAPSTNHWAIIFHAQLGKDSAPNILYLIQTIFQPVHSFDSFVSRLPHFTLHLFPFLHTHKSHTHTGGDLPFPFTFHSCE